MRKVIGYIIILIAVLFFLMGLIFIIASGGSSSRLVPGIILIISGSLLGFLGGSILKTGFDLSPSQVINSILSLAKINNGYLKKEAIIAELGTYPQVEKAMEKMLIDRTAVLDTSGQRPTYIFPDFLHEIVVKYCSYCNTEYPLRDPIQKCSQCGGSITLKKGRIERSDQIFSMDEK